MLWWFHKPWFYRIKVLLIYQKFVLSYECIADFTKVWIYCTNVYWFKQAQILSYKCVSLISQNPGFIILMCCWFNKSLGFIILYYLADFTKSGLILQMCWWLHKNCMLYKSWLNKILDFIIQAYCWIHRILDFII